MNNTSYRLAAAVAIAAVFALIWFGLGVGIIGSDGDRDNRIYLAVIALGIIGTLVARFRPRGMARVLIAMALAQALIAAIAILGGLGRPSSGPLELLLLNGFFVAVFLGSTWLFSRAASSTSLRANR